MKSGFRLTAVITVVLALTLALCFGEALAQEPLLKLRQATTLKPTKEQVPTIQKRQTPTGTPDLMCPNPWISVAHTDSPQGPFAGDCNCCFQQGYMLMTKAMCYVRNVGNGPSVPCRAKLTWVDRNNAGQERIVDLPAIEAGDETFVNVTFASAQAFNVAYPVTLAIDYLNQARETNESNNSVSFDFQQFKQQYPYQFMSCQ